MKTKRLLLLSCICSLMLFTQGSEPAETIKWTNFSKISKKKGKKMVFIELETSWCQWCRRMENLTFTDPTVAKYMNKNFQNIRFNAEEKRPITFLGRTYMFNNDDGPRGRHGLARALMQDCDKQGYPTVAFLDANYNLIQAIPGYIKSKDFEAIMKYFGDGHYQAKTWPDFVKQYNIESEGSSPQGGE